MDFFPTLERVAGLDSKAGSDGENLLPLLRSKGKLRRKAIYFHYPNYAWHRSNRLGSAVREGRYKLIERFDDSSVELYDLESDLGERKNLAEKLPQKAAQLRRKLVAWRKDARASMPARIGK